MNAVDDQSPGNHESLTFVKSALSGTVVYLGPGKHIEIAKFGPSRVWIIEVTY